MKHPFYSSLTFPFQRPEAKKLYDHLLSLISEPGLIDGVYKQSMPVVTPINPTQNIPIIWSFVLDEICKTSNFASFCSILRSNYYNVPTLLEILDEIDKARSMIYNRIFSGDIYVLDCESQRDVFEAITSDSNTRFLLVKGPSKSGKSWLRHILINQARERGITITYLRKGMIVTVEDAIERIFSALGENINTVLPVDTRSVAWYRSVCNKLLEIASKNNKKAWLIIDDLGYSLDQSTGEKTPLLPETVRLFFEQLAMNFIDPAFSQYFRLIMIDYAENVVPISWENSMYTTIQSREDSIQQNHIQDFLVDWLESKEKVMTPEGVKTAVNEIMGDVENRAVELSHLSRLGRIYQCLSDKLLTL